MKWGKELKEAMEAVGEGAICNIIRNGNEDEMKRRIRRGRQIKTDQEIQDDWNRTEKPEFFKDYKYLKDNIGMEKYGEDKEIKGEEKKTWARMRCGSVGKEVDRGYKNVKCRMCVKENETLEHVLECEEAKVEMKKELVEGKEKWRNKERGDKLRIKLITCLREKPIQDLCSYVREFERLAKKREHVEL